MHMKTWKLLTIAGIFTWAWTSLATPQTVCAKGLTRKVERRSEPRKSIPVVWTDEPACAQKYLQ
jgi:hypothetical protein